MIDRRSFAAAALLTPLMHGRSAIAAGTQVQEFAVYRDDAPIGRHRLGFTRDGAQLTVEIDIELEVKLAFITLYRYRHHNRERWEAGRLLGFASRTDDNGARHEVMAQRRGDTIVVAGSRGQIEAPGDALPTTYWHHRFLDAPLWIDTQEGTLKRFQVTPAGAARIAGTAAERYAIGGDLALDLWYAGPHWVKLAFAGPDGSRIDYRLEQGVPDLAVLAG